MKFLRLIVLCTLIFNVLAEEAEEDPVKELDQSIEVDAHRIAEKIKEADPESNALGLSRCDYWKLVDIIKYAIENNRIDLLDVLIKSPSWINDRSYFFGYHTPLEYSFVHGNNEVVQWFIDHGADVRSINSDGTTTLAYALKSPANSSEPEDRNLKLLLKTAARKDLNTADKFGNTPLHYTALWENYAKLSCLVEAFVQSDVSLNKKNRHGNTALDHARVRDKDGLRWVDYQRHAEILEKRGARCNNECTFLENVEKKIRKGKKMLKKLQNRTKKVFSNEK